MALLIVTTTTRGQEFLDGARSAAGGGLDIRIWPDVGRIEDIEYALAWLPPKGVLKTLPNLKMIVSVGAGVDHLLIDPELPDVPVVRYVDPDLTGRMAEYIGLQVLFHQRRMAEFLELQFQRKWHYLPEPAAHEVRVGVMGLGVMGLAALKVLAPFGYQLRGWSRTRKSVAGVTCFAGRGELDAFLAETDILACVLPHTPETRGILNADLIGKLSRNGRHERLPGPVLINAGRGPLQVETDILQSLDSGALYAASLDVFEVEPLPASSPLWAHKRVVITPHNAAESTGRAITRYFIRQVHAHGRGEPIGNVVDRSRGY
jgi:glyoxylate/hydroxypyruvate reductase A